MNLYRDSNSNGRLDGGEPLVSSGTYPSDNGMLSLSFSDALPTGTTDYLVTYSFSGGAVPGSYQASVLPVTGLTATGPSAVQFTGSPVNGAVVTIATATATPTNTTTPSSTQTATFTPTPVTGTVICEPYPNPATGSAPVCVCVAVPRPSTITYDVFTTAFRKIAGGVSTTSTTANIQWDLRDSSGAYVANGLYYLRVSVTGPQPVVKILKVMVVR